jgi:hypothetical protein
MHQGQKGTLKYRSVALQNERNQLRVAESLHIWIFQNTLSQEDDPCIFVPNTTEHGEKVIADRR